MYCSVCGNENEEGAKFCTNCGQNLNPSRTKSTPTRQQSDHTAVKVIGWGGAILMPIIGVIASIILMVKDEAPHGLIMLATSIFMMFFWAGVWA